MQAACRPVHDESVSMCVCICSPSVTAVMCFCSCLQPTATFCCVQEADATLESQPVPKPKVKQGRPPTKKQLDPLADPTPTSTPTPVSSSVAPGPDPAVGISPQADRAPLDQEMITEADHDMALDMNSEAGNEFAMPDWLSTKYTSSTVTLLAPSQPEATPTRPHTRMAASSFKPKRRKKTTPVILNSQKDDWASDMSTAGQAAGRGGTAGQTLEAGDLSFEEVDRDPRLTSEADAVIDAGIASGTPSVTPETNSGRDTGGVPNSASGDSDEPSDVDNDTDVDSDSEGYAGIACCIQHCDNLLSACFVLLLGLCASAASCAELHWQLD